MKKRVLFLAILLLSFASLNAQNLKLGNPAPTITISEWLANGEDTKGNPLNLDNKFIVLEFWATWCGPCIRAIPHINDLQSKFGSDSVVFVSISRESKEKITQFLQKKEMKASIGWDPSGQSQNNYGVSSIPAAFLINKNGVLLWKGHPATMTEDLLRDAIQNKNDKKFANTPGEQLFGLSIKQSSSEFEFSSKEGDLKAERAQVAYENFKIVDILLDIINIPAHRVEIAGAENQQRYDVNFFYNAPSLPGTMTAQAFFMNAIMSAFEVRVAEAVVEKEVWVLRLPDDFKGDSTVAGSANGKYNVMAVGNQWVFQSVSLNEVASLFENELKTIVLPYATNSAARYNFSLSTAPSRNIQLIKGELEAKYGIKLYKEVRKMSMTVIQFL